MIHTIYSHNQPFSAVFEQFKWMQSPTLQIGFDCLNASKNPEEAVREYPYHAAEIMITSVVLLLSDEGEQSDEKNEVFEEISKLISLHDHLY